MRKGSSVLPWAYRWPLLVGVPPCLLVPRPFCLADLVSGDGTFTSMCTSEPDSSSPSSSTRSETVPSLSAAILSRSVLSHLADGDGRHRVVRLVQHGVVAPIVVGFVGPAIPEAVRLLPCGFCCIASRLGDGEVQSASTRWR